MFRIISYTQSIEVSLEQNTCIELLASVVQNIEVIVDHVSVL